MAATDTTPASDLERRKKVRVRMRLDLSITPQKYEGRTYYVVKDPVSLRYYRFKEQEHFLINMMDGTHTLDEAQKAFENRFRPERLTLEDLEGFAQQLLTAGLAQNESPQAGKLLYDRRKKRKRTEWLQYFTNILYIKIPLYDPDKLLKAMLDFRLPLLGGHPFRWIFTSWFVFASVALWLGALALVMMHFQTFRDKLPSYHEFFTFKNVMFLWVALGLVKVIHEFGHGLSCKAFGGEVHEMGLLFLVFSPCLYCNVSDAWVLPSKWKRIIISAAGIWVELCIAAIATFVWWNTPANPALNNMALSLMIVCSVSTFIFNANPLMRFDGYYILADWLEIPNLRDRSNKYLQRLVMEHCMGIEVPPEQYMALWRRWLFVIYAIASWLYRWFLTFTILYWMAWWLEPYKLKVVSQLLAVMAGVSLVGWPLYRLAKGIHKRGRLPDMKPVRVTISICVLLFLIGLFLFLKLPVSRVRQTALVQVDPESISKVYLCHSGILTDLNCQDGQYVEEGTILARFRSFELEQELAQAAVQKRVHGLRASAYALLKQQSTELSQPDRDELDRKVMQAWADQERYELTEKALSKLRDEGLTLRAQVVDPAGRPLEGATVHVADESNHAVTSEDLSATSGADGWFELHGLSPGKKTLTVFLAGYTAAWRSFEPESPPTSIVLKPSLKLRGEVVDAATGLPIEAFALRLEFEGTSMITDAQPHPGGLFEDDVPGDVRCKVTISAPGYEPLTLEDLVPSSTAVAPARFRLLRQP